MKEVIVKEGRLNGNILVQPKVAKYFPCNFLQNQEGKKKKNTFQNYLEEKRMFFSIGKSDETSYRLKNQIEKIEIAEEPDS